MNILNLNQLLKENGLQEFPLDFAEQLNNKNLNNIDKTEIINVLKTVNNGQNPLMYILYCNKHEELRFKSNDIMDLINLYPKQLLQVDINGDNPLIIILRKNHIEKLELKNNDIINLINLYPEQLLQVNNNGWNPLMFILRYNKEQELGLTREDILNIINLFPEQLLQVNKYGNNLNPLMFILLHNKEQELGLTRKDILNIINLFPEQLLHVNKYGWNPLMLILANNKTQKLGFSFEYINNIYEKQINKKYNYIGYNNRNHTILFNEEYILNKLNFLNGEVTFYQEFLDYRKTLLEKQKITNILKVKQENKTCINFKV